MKIKEEAIKEIEEMKPAELLRVYDLILSLKGKPAGKKGEIPAYLRVRDALKQFKDSLSDDILSAREDRV